MSEPKWLKELYQLFEDKSINEVMLCEDHTLILTKQQLYHSRKTFVLPNNFTQQIQEFSFSKNQRLDPFCPFAGGSIRKGVFRWHAVIPPVVKNSRFFLRKHRFESLSLSDFTFQDKTLYQIKNIIAKQLPFLIVGATGAGKTSLLALILSFMKKDRVIILEEYEEIPIVSDYWFKLLTTRENIEQRNYFQLKDLFREALRMRPDHLVLGELRGPELKIFLELCNSGHSSACSTIHAGSRRELINRMQFILGEPGSKDLVEESSLQLIFIERSETKPKVTKILKI